MPSGRTGSRPRPSTFSTAVTSSSTPRILDTNAYGNRRRIPAYLPSALTLPNRPGQFVPGRARPTAGPPVTCRGFYRLRRFPGVGGGHKSGKKEKIVPARIYLPVSKFVGEK